MIKSAFAEFNIALRGLTVAQSNVQVSSHNIANATTTGYSRQYAQQETTRPFASGRVGMWGTGAEVSAVLQFRSAFLDTQFRTKSSVLGQYAIKNAQLGMTEVTFGALGEDGLTAQIDSLFNTLEDLSSNPESLTNRNNTISQSVTITQQIASVGKQLQDQQISANQEIKTVVDSINSMGIQISALNNQIKISEANGAHANDLRDQRNLLIDELSKYVNINVKEVQRNKEYNEKDPTSGPSNIELTVQINGYNFVDGDQVYQLKCVQRANTEKVNEMDADGLYNLEFSGSGLKFNLYSNTLEGQLKGLIDVRDGNNSNTTMAYDALLGKTVMVGTESPQPDPANYPGGATDPNYIKDLGKYFDVDSTRYTTEAQILAARPGNNATRTLSTGSYKGLPHYMNKLNNFIRTFALSINEGKTFDTSNGYGKSATKNDLVGVNGHINSYDLNGNPGELFFTYKAGGIYQTTGEILDYTNITFANFHVNPDLLSDPALLACSDSPTSGEANANSLKQLISLKTNTKIFKEGTYQDYLIAMTGELAITKKQADNFDKNYTEVVSLTDNQRMSVSGVDTNEEMVNLTRNQQLYQASAKLISILSTIYSTCIDLGR